MSGVLEVTQVLGHTGQRWSVHMVTDELLENPEAWHPLLRAYCDLRAHQKCLGSEFSLSAYVPMHPFRKPTPKLLYTEKGRTDHPLSGIHRGSKMAKNWYPIKIKLDEPGAVST